MFCDQLLSMVSVIVSYTLLDALDAVHPHIDFNREAQRA